MIRAISIGAAVTSHTRWPWSRCSCARARVPGQIRWAIPSSKISSTDLLQLGDGVAGDEAERRAAGLGDVLGVLDPDEAEVGLLPGGPEDLAGREELAAVQAPGEVEDAGALHDGVVDVEERRGGRVDRGVEGASPPRPRPRRPRPPASSAAAGRALGAVGPRHALRVVRGGARGRRTCRRTTRPPGRARGGCGRIRPCRRPTLPTWSPRPPRTSRTGLAVVESGGRALTWGELEDGGRPLRHRAGPPRRAWPGTG